MKANKKKLYEAIMQNVSKIIKKHLNESYDYEDLFTNVFKSIESNIYTIYCDGDMTFEIKADVDYDELLDYNNYGDGIEPITITFIATNEEYDYKVEFYIEFEDLIDAYFTNKLDDVVEYYLQEAVEADRDSFLVKGEKW